MTRDLGVWTYADSALVLIDYQKEMFETRAIERVTPGARAEHRARRRH